MLEGLITNCSSCGKQITIPAGWPGGLLKCPYCGNSRPILRCIKCSSILDEEAYLDKDGRIWCRNCFASAIKPNYDLTIHPPSNGLIKKIYCPKCSKGFWLREIQFELLCRCPYCSHSFSQKNSLFGLIESIKLAVWIIAGLMLASFVFGLIALLFSFPSS